MPLTFLEKALAILVLAAVTLAIWLMIAVGIEIGLRSKYDDRERAHREKEAQLRRNVRELAWSMYMNAIAQTRVNVNMRAVVVEDDLGKGSESHV